MSYSIDIFCQFLFISSQEKNSHITEKRFKADDETKIFIIKFKIHLTINEPRAYLHLIYLIIRKFLGFYHFALFLRDWGISTYKN